jgi:REP element-mobilizing transposase RayT
LVSPFGFAVRTIARPIRLQYPDAVYHVMARGNQGREVFLDHQNRQQSLATLVETCAKTGWSIHAYVLLANHYHLLLQTPEPNLVAGMKWLQGTYGLGIKARRKELEQQWQALRRGWYVGDKTFAQQLEGYLDGGLQGRQRESFSGPAKASHDVPAAERALARGMAWLGLSEEGLRQLPKAAAEKVVLAWWVRQRTTVPLRWVAERLAMGHYNRVTQAVSRMRRRPVAKLEKLRRKLCDALDPSAKH